MGMKTILLPITLGARKTIWQVVPVGQPASGTELHYQESAVATRRRVALLNAASQTLTFEDGTTLKMDPGQWVAPCHGLCRRRSSIFAD